MMQKIGTALDEIEGRLAWELEEFDALIVQIEALRAKADDLWASRIERLEIVDALQKVYALFNGGVPHPSAVPEVIDDRDSPADEPHIDDCTPGHTTIIDVGQVAQQVVPTPALTVVANALQQCGHAIHVKELTAVINHPHYRIPKNSVSKYLRDLYQTGLAERPTPGVYVWVGEKEDTDE